MKLHYVIYGKSGIPVYEIQIPHVDSVFTDKREVFVLRHSGVLESLPLTGQDYDLEVYE